MKKIFSILEVLVVLFCLFGCSRTFTSEEEDKATDEFMPKITDAFLSKDADKIRALMSVVALEQADDIEEGIKYTLVLLKDEAITIEPKGIAYGEHTGNPAYHKSMEGNIDIFTESGKKYNLYFLYYYEYKSKLNAWGGRTATEADKDMLGVYRMKLTDMSTLPENYHNKIFGGGFDRAGIYWPGWDEYYDPKLIL